MTAPRRPAPPTPRVYGAKPQAPQPASSGGSPVRAGLLAGIVLALVWLALAYATRSGLGVVAWGMGALIGIVVARAAHPPTPADGARAALLTLVSVLLAKALIFSIALRPIIAGELLDAPQALTMMFVDDMVSRHAFSPELQATLDSMERAQGDTAKSDHGLQLSLQMMTEASARARAAPAGERDRIIRTHTDAAMAKQSFGELAGRLFSWLDIAWIALGASTAARLGRRASQRDGNA